MTCGYISIGSNIDKERNITAGLAALKQEFGELQLSSLYESEPVGFVGDAFYNLVVAFESKRDVYQVAEKLRQIEVDHGRPAEAKKFSARTLDLDLILYGDLIVNDAKLQIPRIDIERYAFVLEPLAEIASDLNHPVLKISYAALWQQMDKDKVLQRRIPFPPVSATLI